MQEELPHDVMRDALVEDLRTLRRDGTCDRHRLRRSLSALCVDARARGVLPERLVILIKEMWVMQPGAREISNAGDSGARLSTVVTMLLDTILRVPTVGLAGASTA